jgi:hypothetical protein
MKKISSESPGGHDGHPKSASNYYSSHQSRTTATSKSDRKCDNCRYWISVTECTTFKCKDCGTYILCDYCYEDYLEKNEIDEEGALPDPL